MDKYSLLTSGPKVRPHHCQLFLAIRSVCHVVSLSVCAAGACSDVYIQRQCLNRLYEMFSDMLSPTLKQGVLIVVLTADS